MTDCDYLCYVISVFLAVPLFGVQSVIVVFPDHIHLLTFVAFGQAIHQTNRVENLVQLFNAESHAIAIKPVHGIDDAITKFVFDKCVEKMDMYISLIIMT